MILLCNYYPFSPSSSMKDPDFFLMQCCVCVCGWDLFVSLMLAVFQLEFFFLPPWFWKQYGGESRGEDGVMFIRYNM